MIIYSIGTFLTKWLVKINRMRFILPAYVPFNAKIKHTETIVVDMVKHDIFS